MSNLFIASDVNVKCIFTVGTTFAESKVKKNSNF